MKMTHSRDRSNSISQCRQQVAGLYGLDPGSADETKQKVEYLLTGGRYVCKQDNRAVSTIDPATGVEDSDHQIEVTEGAVQH